MLYDNLERLFEGSSSARRYFLSLPVKLQMELHAQSDYIRTAQDLHRRADMARLRQKQAVLSGFLDR